jgi:TRAP-type C4-dicarboxylate transport system substrate-binding protein
MSGLGLHGRLAPSMKLGRRAALKAGVRAVAAVGAPAIVQAQAGLKLPLATILPDGNFHTINARHFAEEVKKATSGAVEIDVKSGGELSFTGPEQLRAVRDGLVPMADILDTQQIGDHPIMGVEAIPFLCASAAELKVLHKYLRPEFEKVALKNNQTIFYMVPWPAQYLHLKIKAESVDGLQTVKIRVPDKGTHDMCRAIGMAPALIPWGETIAALSSGAVSGVSTSAVSGVDGKFWEVLKFFHATNHTWSSQIVTINNDTWKKISPANQKAIFELAAKLEPAFWERSLQVDNDSARKLSDGGMQSVAVPEPMMAELRKRTAPMVVDFCERVPPAEKPIKAYLAEMKRA